MCCVASKTCFPNRARCVGSGALLAAACDCQPRLPPLEILLASLQKLQLYLHLEQACSMDWLFGIFGVCSSRGAKPPPPAADIEKDSSTYKGPCAEDGDLPDDLMAPGRLYNLCKAKEAPPIDLVQQLLSDPTKKNERISYKSPKDNE